MEEYIMVSATGESYLIRYVNEKIKEGYVCQGSPFIVDRSWYQAMVLAK